MGATVMFAAGVLVHFHQAKIASRMPPHKVRGTSIDLGLCCPPLENWPAPCFPRYEAHSG